MVGAASGTSRTAPADRVALTGALGEVVNEGGPSRSWISPRDSTGRCRPSNRAPSCSPLHPRRARRCRRARAVLDAPLDGGRGEPPDRDGGPRGGRDRQRAPTSTRLGTVETLQRSLLPDRLPDLDSVTVALATARRREGRRRLVRRARARRRAVSASRWATWSGTARRGVADGPAAARDAGVRARRPPPGWRARPARPARAQPRRSADGDAHVPGGRAGPVVGPACERRPRAAAPPRAGRAGRVPGRRPDPPLGVFESPSHSEVEIALEPGSTLILYTDGLVEQRGTSIDVGLGGARAAAIDPGEDPEALSTGCSRRCSRCTAERRHSTARTADAARAAGPFRAEMQAAPDELVSMRRGLRAGCGRGGARRGGRCDPDRVPRGLLELDRARLRLRLGRVTVEADTGPEGVLLEVRDSGEWVERPDGPLPFRGHGLPLMEALMDSVKSIAQTPGPWVSLRRRLACQATEECSSTRSNGSGTRASASPSEGPLST